MPNPLIIASHGFSAKAYEWAELEAYVTRHSSIEVKRIQLGGHNSEKELKTTPWSDWGDPILEAYDQAIKNGHTNINFVLASTSATLVLNYLAIQKLPMLQYLKNIIMVDPFLVPRNKGLKWISILGPFIRSQDWGQYRTKEEQHHWINHIPYQALVQLNSLRKRVASQLKGKIKLDKHVQITVYKTIGDPVVDPTSATLISDGIDYSSNQTVQIHWIRSKLHVFPRGTGRPANHWLKLDQQNQLWFFNDVILKCLG